MTDAESGVNFDLDGDGLPERLGWTAADSDESFLALDRNGNAFIDSGAELFGDFTEQPPSQEPNGFLALAVFDRSDAGGDQDGVITPSDLVFDHLLLWRDNNHDGLSQPEELHSLADAGIISVSLDYRESHRRDAHGNEYRYFALVTRDDPGLSRLVAVDVFLVGAP